MDWPKLITTIGVPSALLFYVLIRLESAINNLTAVTLVNGEKLDILFALLAK